MTHARSLPLLLLAAFLATLSVACQPAPHALTPSPTSTRAPLTPHATSTIPASSNIGIPEEALKGVKVEVWMPWFGVDANLFESQVDEFNKTNPWGITVETTSQSNYTELYNNVTAALPTPARPQLVIAFPEHAFGWDTSGQVVDLTRYVNDPKYGFSDEEVRDFPPVFWSQDTIGQKRVGVPAERTARFMLYNESWARELGYLSAPKTASDFRQQACAAHQTMLKNTDRKDDGQGGWLVDTNATTFVSWMSAFGGGILDGASYRFLTPKNLTALTFVKKLYDDGCAWVAQPGADPAAVFAARKALFATAALEGLPDYSRAMAAADNTDEWTALAFPGDSGSSLETYGSSYVILKSSPEQQLASWLFVRWLLSPENQKKWVEVEGMLPLRDSALALLGDYQKSHPQWAEAVSLLPSAEMEPQLATWRTVRTMIGDGFNAMFQSNTPSGRVAEVLAIMETTARDLTK
ncbi:MAG TPA: extracellular solute-binding protein [Anaerolineales bacterium]|nr:extracellular solute-binding protein [Anaerolineales bacterium]